MSVLNVVQLGEASVVRLSAETEFSTLPRCKQVSQNKFAHCHKTKTNVSQAAAVLNVCFDYSKH